MADENDWHRVVDEYKAEDRSGTDDAAPHEANRRDGILEHVRRCWASLFSERAVAYRARNRVDERTVQMAVVVQRMVPAKAAGVLFTADPVTGNGRSPRSRPRSVSARRSSPVS